MTVLEKLKSEGWHLSNEGYDLCSENVDHPTPSSVIQKALNMDLREIGGNFFSEDFTKGKTDYISGPGVVQIQKIKNASAPKYEYGSGAPPVLRLLLTDGNNYVNALQWGHWKSITMDTPPGTKIFLKPTKISVVNNFLLLSENQFSVLGGCVTAMVEKWELCRQLASHIRTKDNLDGTGPPPWIPFGQKIISSKPLKSTNNFRALDTEAKECKEDAIFKQQRQANIAEVSRVKETKAKSFGGRKDFQKPAFSNLSNQVKNENDRYQDFTHNSPIRSKVFTNDKSGRSNRNDFVQAKQENGRSQPSNNISLSAYIKDNKLENKNKLGDFITVNLPQPSSVQAKAESSDKNSKPFKDSSSVHKPKNLINMMQQVKIHNYDEINRETNSDAFSSTLKPGMEVMAKYWEDNQFYRAKIYEISQEKKTCVVYFIEYGNHEEVYLKDICEKVPHTPRNWNAGPISFEPSKRNNYENYTGMQNQNSRDFVKRQNFNGSYGRPEDKRAPRGPAKLYQPPNRRETNY